MQKSIHIDLREMVSTNIKTKGKLYRSFFSDRSTHLSIFVNRSGLNENTKINTCQHHLERLIILENEGRCKTVMCHDDLKMVMGQNHNFYSI